MENTYVSSRISEKDCKLLDKIVETGRYMNRSDAIRTAIRALVDKEKKYLDVTATD